MRQATIILSDTGLDQFQARIEYEGETGFDEHSNAHQYGLMLMQQLNRWADLKGPEQIFGNAPATREAADHQGDRTNQPKWALVNPFAREQEPQG